MFIDSRRAAWHDRSTQAVRDRHSVSAAANEDAFKKSGTIIGGGRSGSEQPRGSRTACAGIRQVLASRPTGYWHTVSGYYPIRKSAYEQHSTKTGAPRSAFQTPLISSRRRTTASRRRTDRRLPNRTQTIECDRKTLPQGDAAAGAGQGC